MRIPLINRISKNGVESLDVVSYCFQEYRDIYISEPITDEMAAAVIAQLLYLDRCEKKDIHIYINSMGGSVTAGLAIYDTIRLLRSDVVTICIGIAASMGAFLLAAAGTKGKRMATPQAEVMIHQPLGCVQGQAADIELEARHIAATKQKLYQILAEVTGQSAEKISQDCDRDHFLSAEEAVEYGLIDQIVMRSVYTFERYY